jgi:hypothetical protein
VSRSANGSESSNRSTDHLNGSCPARAPGSGRADHLATPNLVVREARVRDSVARGTLNSTGYPTRTRETPIEPYHCSPALMLNTVRYGRPRGGSVVVVGIRLQPTLLCAVVPTGVDGGTVVATFDGVAQADDQVSASRHVADVERDLSDAAGHRRFCPAQHGEWDAARAASSTGPSDRSARSIRGDESPPDHVLSAG